MEFKKIEEKWQRFWDNQQLCLAKDPITKSQETNNNQSPNSNNQTGEQKKYILVEFPYPSGSGLHVGHAFSFMGADVYARFWRMKGFNVLFPMGWDAFGLPTENYAIKTKRKPQEVTKENTENFKKEMKRLAFSFDWSREVNTTDPDYYRWTQWIFIKLFERGLAYKQEMPINWCPSCKIGLANEEVVDNKCERCGAEVSRRNISQWVVKITDYADRLIEGLKDTDFIDKVKQAQINWIGKSEGARIRFKVKTPLGFAASPLDRGDHHRQGSNLPCQGEVPEGGRGLELEVFTTRVDTLWGVTFMVISPEHPFVATLLKSKVIKSESLKAMEEYVKQARKKSDLERAELQKEKTGVFTGIYVVNPANGKEIPLWVADYVLMGYGTGVVMGVPAHDQRDWDFAKKYGLEIIPVIDDGGNHDYQKSAMVSVDTGVMINSGFVTGIEVKEAIVKVNEWVEKEGVGRKTSMYHLRDWIFSRQHYWGEPIPMISCSEHGWVPVPEEELPVRLPEVEHYEPTDTGESPLAKISEFVNTVCPACGGPAKRETDTMPNWAGSDWYYIAYAMKSKIKDQKSKNVFVESEKELKYWMPVDIYIGGDEHNTLHLLYSRFIYKFLFDLGVVPTTEPYWKRISHGVILGSDNQRMSKSRGNVIVPSDVADRFGADVLRMYLMFMGPFDATMAWNEKTVLGVKRFLDKFEKLVTSFQLRVTSESNKEARVLINKLIVGVTKDLEEFGYNTAIAKMMEALNKLTVMSYELRAEDVKTLIKLLAPFAPYTSEELWHGLGEDGSVHVAAWPEVEEKYLVEETVIMPVMVNGKVRDQLTVTSYELRNQEDIIKMAKELPKIKRWLKGGEVIREIYVPGKLVNLVVKKV